MATATSVSSGTVLGGDFRVIELLRSGGMGAVYVADQLSTGKRRALKLMRPETVDDARLRERFEQEAKVGALIASDHVVEVIGAGIDTPTGIPWIAMELLEGEDLSCYVRERGVVSFEEVRQILGELCHAVAAAHDAGVVHRDLKPENVFLAAERKAAAKRTVKVLDFGIAKLLASARTLATSAVGTPAWMAPEQTDARVAISPAADIWALGLLTFWLLTGRSYWLSSANPSSAVHAMLREILFDPLEPASVRARDRGAAGLLPRGFDGWFARAVARDPRQRFASARALLEAFLALEPPDESAAERAAPPPDTPSEPGPTEPLSTRSFLADLSGAVAAAEAAAAGRSPAAAPSLPSQPDVGAGAAGTVVMPSEPPAEPLVPDASAAAIAAAPAAGRPRRLLGLVVGGLALLAVAVYAWPRPPGASGRIGASPWASTTPSASVGSAAQAEPSVAASLPVADSSDLRGPQPPSSSVPGAPGSASHPRRPKAPPFDPDNAQRQLEFTARGSAPSCAVLDGPRALVATVTFDPSSGLATAVQVSPSGSGAAMCMWNVLRSSRVPAFSGGPQSVGISVTLPPDSRR